MHETMKPRDAAKIFDRLDANVPAVGAVTDEDRLLCSLPIEKSGRDRRCREEKFAAGALCAAAGFGAMAVGEENA